MNINRLKDSFRANFEPVDGLEITLNGATVTIKAIVSPCDVPESEFTFGNYKGRLISHQDATGGDDEKRSGYKQIIVEIEEVKMNKEDELAIERGLNIKEYPTKWRQAKTFALQADKTSYLEESAFEYACKLFQELGGEVNSGRYDALELTVFEE